MNKKFGAVILAAGYSSRMGTFKPLLELGGQTIIERLLGVLVAAGIKRKNIVVVTGHNREALLPAVKKYKVRKTFNPRYDQGMFTSIQTGASSMADGLDGFFIMPVDCPLISPKVLKQLIKSFEPDKFSVACYRGKKGHPLLVPEKFRQEIIDHDGKNGLKAITDRDFGLMKRMETGFEGVILDMDTPQAYEEIQKYLAGGCKSENLQELAKGRRFILVRHGQIEQHKEKIFLGQTDVPLSKRGKEQAASAGKQICGIDLHTDRIYTSDLVRASQTAEIIADSDARIKGIIPDQGLREMNLGPWDGKFISEIKASMPEEYEKRGQHLMIYKMGHGSENFYDLQYRVCRTLTAILKKDEAKDIVIVAHSGVLRVIENNFRGGDVSEPWTKLNNGEIRVIEK